MSECLICEQEAGADYAFYCAKCYTVLVENKDEIKKKEQEIIRLYGDKDKFNTWQKDFVLGIRYKFHKLWNTKETSIKTHNSKWCNDYQPRYRQEGMTFWCANCGLLLGLRDMDRYYATEPIAVDKSAFLD